MKKLNILIIALTLISLSSCSVIGGIFKAGFAVGIVVVVIIVLLLIWVISSFRGKN